MHTTVTTRRHLALFSRKAALLIACVLIPAAATAQNPLTTEPTPPLTTLPVSHFNLHLVATENWLNRFVARTETTSGIVDDFILGAKVDGEQITTSHLRLDLRPNTEQIAATFVLRGDTDTNTSGTTEQAVVFTHSRQHFDALKDVFFDGQVLSTRHATVTARARNQPLGASTRFDGTPLQPLVSKFVMKAAEERRPEAETIARNKVVDRIYPEFDQRIDRELSQANDQLETVVRKRLRDWGVLPAAQRCQSTDNELHYAARIATAARDFEIVPPSSPLLTSEGVRLYLHHSVLETAALQAGLAGLKTSDRELGQILRRWGMSSGDSGGSTGVETQIEFDSDRPLSIVFEDDQMEFRLRVKLRPAGQALLPPLTIAIPFRLVDQDGERLLRPGQIGVTTRSEDGRETAPIPGMEAIIRQTISSSLQDIPLPKVVGDASWYNGKTPPRLTTLRFKDGWLAVGLD